MCCVCSNELSANTRVGRNRIDEYTYSILLGVSRICSRATEVSSMLVRHMLARGSLCKHLRQHTSLRVRRSNASSSTHSRRTPHGCIIEFDEFIKRARDTRRTRKAVPPACASVYKRIYSTYVWNSRIDMHDVKRVGDARACVPCRCVPFVDNDIRFGITDNTPVVRRRTGTLKRQCLSGVLLAVSR